MCWTNGCKGELEKGSPFTTRLIYHQHLTWNKSVTQIWARLPQLPWTFPIRISCQVTLTAFTAQLLSIFATTNKATTETKQNCAQGSRTSMDHILKLAAIKDVTPAIDALLKAKDGRQDTQWFCDTPLWITEVRHWGFLCCPQNSQITWGVLWSIVMLCLNQFAPY